MHTRIASSSLFALGLLLVTGANLGTIGCSTSPKPPFEEHSNAQELSPGKITSSLTSACRLETVGLPCDPDGAGSATECEGLCWVDDAAEVSCVPVAAANLIETDLNGRICGDEQGRDCSRSCENGECVTKNARLGTACRPGINTTTCDGVCTLVSGEPVCDEVSVCDDVAISNDGCTLTACNFESFEQGCITVELTNSVCEASQSEPDAALDTSADAGSGVRPDAGSIGVSSESNDASAGTDSTVVTSPEDASSARDSGAVSTNSGSASSGPSVDGGDLDGGRPSATPARVVGGACSVGLRSSADLVWVGALAIASLFVRRKVTHQR